MIVFLFALIAFNIALELKREKPENDMPEQVVWEYGGHDWRNIDGIMTHDKDCKNIEHGRQNDN